MREFDIDAPDEYDDDERGRWGVRCGCCNLTRRIVRYGLCERCADATDDMRAEARRST